MTPTGAVLGLAGAVSVAVWYWVWRYRLAARFVTAHAVGRRVSRFLVIGYLAVNFIDLTRRSDEALLAQGLSVQNRVQVALSVVCVLWAAWLLAARRVDIRALFVGPSFWFSALLLAYLASTAWSVWPLYTGYRIAELAGLWVIGLHLFSRPDWSRSLMAFAAWAAVVFLSSGLIAVALDISPYADLANAMRSNQGSLMAAAVAVVLVHHRLFLNLRTPLWQWLALVLVFVLFGSLASFIALVAAVAVALLSRPSALRPLWASLALMGVVLGLLYGAQGVDERNPLVRGVAQASGKSPENILNFTGRIPLWAEIWEKSHDKPFGFGFAAGDRAFVVDAAARDSVGWEAGHAHNGYLSAWLGAGFVGVTFLALGLWAIGRKALTLPSEDRALILGLLVLLSVNNLTIPAVGGQMGPAWMVAAALCAAPGSVRRRIQGFENARLNGP